MDIGGIVFIWFVVMWYKPGDNYNNFEDFWNLYLKLFDKDIKEIIYE